MIIDEIPIGEAPPWDINVIIEVPFGREPVKYEMDKKSGALFVDRVMHTSMRYPCNYGFVPHTLSQDGDPVDILVASPVEFLSGCIVRCRPVGVLCFESLLCRGQRVLRFASNFIGSDFSFFYSLQRFRARKMG